MKKASKIVVPDNQIFMVWACDASHSDEDTEHSGDENGEISVSPDFFEENGTPMCMCGEDMIYLRTEVAGVKLT